MTVQSESRFIDFFMAKLDADGELFIAPANVYVSHVWDSKFVATAEVLLVYAEENPGVYFFLDVLVNSQHTIAMKSADWWKSTFPHMLEAIGTELVVFTYWGTQSILTRAWCLYEV